jgi:phosphatidylserine/phosphatidylglycerophosphate/cardiolipin synthase-like enzyme
MVLGRTSLETGSFNYTTAAVKCNAENALLLWNVPQIAEIYAREWERLWEESK